MKIHIIAALLIFGLLHGFSALADPLPDAKIAVLNDSSKQNSPVDVLLTVRKILLASGKESRVDAGHAEPGDILEYRAKYKNIGRAVLTKVSATLPLPEHTTFVAGSAAPGEVAVSTRSEKELFMPMSLAPKIISEGKKTASSPSDYGALRWEIEKLMPGQTVIVSARVRVDASTQGNLMKSAPIVQTVDTHKNTH